MDETNQKFGVGLPDAYPRPDPTKRTLESLYREVDWLIKLLEAYYSNQKEVSREAKDARDRAITLLQEFANRSPTTSEVAGQVISLKELTLEMFRSLSSQLQAIKEESKIALGAALQAQEKSAAAANQNFKESINKSEELFTKAADEQRRVQQATQKSTDDKIGEAQKTFDSKIEDVKKRVEDGVKEVRESHNRLEARVGSSEGRSKGIGDGWGYLVGGIGVIVAVLTLVVAAASVYIKVGQP